MKAYLRRTEYCNSKGFTLIELLVVIAVIGIISTVVLIAINPSELMKQARDSQRLNDLPILDRAIRHAMADPNFIQLPVCTDLPASLSTTNCGLSSVSSRASNGTGWLRAADGSNPLNLMASIGVLPIDPMNGKTIIDAKGSAYSGFYYYKSNGNTFKVAAHMESTKNLSIAANDGGTEGCVNGSQRCMFEVGNDLSNYDL